MDGGGGVTLGAIIIMKNGKYRAFVYVVAWVGWLATQAMDFKGAINYSGRIKLTTKCCHHLYCCPARWMVVQSMCGGGTERELDGGGGHCARSGHHVSQ